MRSEIELQETSNYKKRDHLPLRKVIEQYIRDFQPTGRTKYVDLTAIAKRDIALKNVHTLTSKDLIAHIRERNKSR